MNTILLEQPTDELLERIEEMIRSNHLLDAYADANKVALPLKNWPQGRARKVASTLCDGLGDIRMGRVLDWLNWRADRENDHYYFLALFGRIAYKSHYELIAEIEQRLDRKQSSISAKDRSNLLGFLSWVYALLRDFETAHRLLEEAFALGENLSWLHVEKSSVLDLEDRYEEALEAAKRASEIRPNYRPAVLQQSRILLLLGRDDEAMETLQKAHDATQNASFITQLLTHYSERDQHAECSRCLDIAEPMLPLKNKAYQEWFAARRADFAYINGDLEQFKHHASQIKSGYYKKLLDNFDSSSHTDPKRVKLDVPFIRQHNMTCAPATLASLATFWGHEADHLEIAEAICYDGTPWHKERDWAEAQGFITREFRVTREILYALIDRGIPFTLTTTAVTSAHLQACIGYDQRLDLILLRDPTHRHYGEMLMSGLLEDHPLGPRGMLLVPKEKLPLLQDLHFPDAAAFDALHDLAIAIDQNDRIKAQAAMALMRVVAADSPILQDASYRYHAYLGNLQGQWTAMDHLLRLFPEHHSYALTQMSVLQRMQRYSEQRKLAETIIQTIPHDPVFDSEYGEILLADARDLALAERFLIKAMRRQRSQAHVYESLARCREKQRKFTEVARLRKIASCLSPASELYARSYVESCQAIGRTEEGLQHLRQRVEQFGRKDSGPWLSLAGFYNNLNRQEEARNVIHDGLKQLPDDGLLLCRCGSLMMRWGEAEREEGLNMIRRARDKMPEYQWLQEMAAAYNFVGQRTKSIDCWKTYLARQPLSLKGYNSLASLLADENGVDHVLQFLHKACQEQPSLAALWGLYAEWQAFTHDPALKQTLDHILELDPDYVWALRERAEFHMRTGDGKAALADAQEACDKAPYQPESHGVLASILRKCGESEKAAQKLRDAITIHIDYTWAATSLVHLSNGVAEQRGALDFIYQQMCAQVSQGDIVMEYQSLAYPVLAPLELLEQLRDFCRQRPDLWQTWAARKLQCQAMNLADEALECANTMTTSFPLMPRAWAEMADIHHLNGAYQEECVALQKALDLSPSWDVVARRLADAHERLREYEKAEHLLRRMIDLEPLTSHNYTALASLLAKRKRHGEALAIMRKCVTLVPLSRAAWDCYATLAVDHDQTQCVLDDLETISQKQGHRADWWLVAAETCSQLSRGENIIEHCRRGLAINGKNHDLRDLLAFTLTTQGKHEEAIAICQETIDGKPPSREMEGRYCWILLKSGKPVEAIERMERLFEKEPDYLWNISMLASCRDMREQWKELKDLSQHWVRMDPRNAIAHGYLARALMELNQQSLAKLSFQQAVKLDPSYSYACRQLFELQLQAKNFTEAKETLIHLQHYAPGAITVCDEMDLLLYQNRIEDAIRLIDVLLQQKDVVPQQLRWFRDRLTGLQRESVFSRWLTHYMSRKEPLHEAPVIVWIEFMQAKYETAKCARQLQQLNLDEDAKVAAWTALIESTDRPEQLSLLDSIVKQHASYLQSDPSLWNAMGYSYTQMREYAKAAEWLKDWDRRDDANDVTYNNVALALDATSGFGAGDAPRRKAMALFPGSRLMPGMAVNIAFQDIIEGRNSDAEALLANLEEQRLHRSLKKNLHFVRAMLLCTGNLEKAAQEYRLALYDITGKVYPDVRSMILAAEQYIARQVPDFRGKPNRLRSAWCRGIKHPLHMQFIKYNRTFWIITSVILFLLLHYLLDDSR